MNICQCLIINKDTLMNQQTKYEKIVSYAQLFWDIKLDMIFCFNNPPPPKKKPLTTTTTSKWWQYLFYFIKQTSQQV